MKFLPVWLQKLSKDRRGAPRSSFSSVKTPLRGVGGLSAPRLSRFDQQPERAERVSGSRKRFLRFMSHIFTYSPCIISFPQSQVADPMTQTRYAKELA